MMSSVLLWPKQSANKYPFFPSSRDFLGMVGGLSKNHVKPQGGGVKRATKDHVVCVPSPKLFKQLIYKKEAGQSWCAL